MLGRYLGIHQKYCEKHVGLELAPMYLQITHYAYLAAEQWENKWWIFRGSGKRRHKGSPTHFLLIMLSLVAMALCHINQSQILVFKGILGFHRCLKDLSGPSSDRWLYIAFTVNIPLLFQDHLGASSPSNASLISCTYFSVYSTEPSDHYQTISWRSGSTHCQPSI